LGPVVLSGLNVAMETKNYTWNEKNTIYLSLPGILTLIMKSEKMEAENFQKLVCEEFIPTLMKKGTYSLPTTRKYNQKFPTTINSLPSSIVELNTDLINSFYDDAKMEQYIGVSVVYLGVVGIYKHGNLTGYIIKYGISEDIGRRELKEHISTYGAQFKIIFAIPTDNAKKVESEFKQAMEMKRCNAELIFSYYMRTELFLTSHHFTIEKAIVQLENFVIQNPTKAIRERDEKIKQLEYYNTNALAIEQEKTKQLELQVIYSKLQLEMVKYKVDVEEIKMIENHKNIKQDIYLQFLNENTKESSTHIHCSTLYEKFILWFRKNGFQKKLPSNKKFVKNLKIHKTVLKVFVDKKSQIGIKKLNLI
jgi:hypothetical protein